MTKDKDMSYGLKEKDLDQDSINLKSFSKVREYYL